MTERKKRHKKGTLEAEGPFSPIEQKWDHSYCQTNKFHRCAFLP